MKLNSNALCTAEIAEHALRGEMHRRLVYSTYQNLGAIAAGDPQFVAERTVILQFWEERPEEYPEVRAHAAILSAYPTYRSAVGALKKEVAECDESWKHPSYLGSGRRADAFKITHTNQDYAIRIVKDTDQATSNERMSEYIAAMVAGKGLVGIEQMIAASYEDGVTISKLIPGKRLDRMTPEEYLQINYSHLEKAMSVLSKAIDAGVFFDMVDKNILFDEVEGLGFVDCIPGVKARERGYSSSLSSCVTELVDAISAQRMRCATPEQKHIMNHLCNLVLFLKNTGAYTSSSPPRLHATA